MKDKIHLLLAALVVSTSASAATISFTQSSPPIEIKTPIKVIAQGIKGLEKFVKAEGEYTIENDDLNRPVGTKVLVLNMKGDTQQIAIGSIRWSPEANLDPSSSYTFLLSAGGQTKSVTPKKDYCMTVSLDGRALGKSCSSHRHFWDPTTVKNVKLTKDSTIAVELFYPVNQPS